MCNNSYINLDTVVESTTEAAKFPLFETASFQHCVLQPGEVLYIPRHHWHYVRSLEVSFSTSFWWGAKMALQKVIQNKEGGGKGSGKNKAGMEVYAACY